MRKVVLLAAALAVTLAVVASSATSASSENGITARTITIGGTFPLTGRVSGYATIASAMKAYFSYVNARKGPDGRRGIYGRQIVFKIYDDAYNPAQTVQQTRRLVEEDKVFAIVGALGTEHNEAIRPYLNQNKVPQILNATGASTWSRDAKQYPWTGGWQPDY
jgi:branched-chain amino acid transport system substrate-binding protein